MEGGLDMSYLYKLYIVVNDDPENVQRQDVLDAIIEKSLSCHLNIDLVGSKICELNNNCGRCCNCETWVSDQEKSDHVEGFSDGCIIDGNWFCDLCVPPNHPKSFIGEQEDNYA